MLRFLLPVVTVLALTASLPSVVLAQTYPAPAGSVQLIPSTGATGTGQNVAVLCRAIGANGAPLQGATCTMTISSEPGGPSGDASIGSKVHAATTDASGNASFNLFTGSQPGIITLTVKVESLESQVNIIVQVPVSRAP